jgi:hypothetical protein
MSQSTEANYAGAPGFSLRAALAVALAVFAMATASLCALSCSQPAKNWAVCLWSGDESLLPSFSVARVEEGPDQGKIRVASPSGGEVTLPAWRFQLFGDEGGARAWVDARKAYAKSIAFGTHADMRVRSYPAPDTKTVFILRQGFKLKVLGQPDMASLPSPSPAIPASSLNPENWLEVLAPDGTRGFANKIDLRLADLGLTPSAGEKSDISADQIMNRSNWRPESYARMAARGWIDLAELKPEYGIFFTPSARQVRVRLKDVSENFNYGRVLDVGKNRYALEGSGLTIYAEREDSVVASWMGPSETMLEFRFVSMDQNVQELIESANAKALALVAPILSVGREFSGEMGTFRIMNDLSVEWTGFSQYSPIAALDRRDSPSLTADLLFRFPLDKRLVGLWDGSISFRGPRGTTADFLYKLKGGSIYLEGLGEDDLRDGSVYQSSGDYGAEFAATDTER